MSDRIDYATHRRCRACDETKPLTRFRVIPGLKEANRTCDDCRNRPSRRQDFSAQSETSANYDHFLHFPRPFVRLRKPLPALDSTPACPRCGKPWPVSVRCVGYHVTDCAEFAPHFHRSCPGCSREILEADPTRAEMKTVKPPPPIRFLIGSATKIPPLPIGPEGHGPCDAGARLPFYRTTIHVFDFATIIRRLAENK